MSSDQQNKGLQASLTIDRPTASRLGITPQLIDDTLYDAFGQRQVAITYTPLNQYHVVMEVAPEYWQRPETLRDIYVRPAAGDPHPPERLHPVPTGQYVPRREPPGSVPGGDPVVQPGPGGGARPGGDRGGDGHAADWGCRRASRGASRARPRPSGRRWRTSPCLILAALVAVYIVLGVLYESYIHPITILSTLPSAGVGAILALLLCRTDLSVIALIGIILLIGIVKKNAIMMIDFALAAERIEGKPPVEAIYQACLLRFRPIMMTTLAALLGALPLALGTGVGSELRHPLGIAIVGGLLVSQLLTLYTTPVVYLYLDRFRLWLEAVRGGRPRKVAHDTSLGPAA